MPAKNHPTIYYVIITIIMVFLGGFLVYKTMQIIQVSYPITIDLETFEPIERSVPLQFVPDKEHYKITSEAWGEGEIVIATGKVIFTNPTSGLLAYNVMGGVFFFVKGSLTLWLLLILRNVFGSMVGGGTPFIIDNVARIRGIGGLFIGIELVDSLMETAVGMTVGANVVGNGLELLFPHGYGFSLNSSLTISLLFLALAEVFRYGIQLQIENDLTI